MAASMRVFFRARTWRTVVSTPQLLTELINGNDALFHRTLVALEAAKAKIFKQRYQGQHMAVSVLSVLAKYDWSELGAVPNDQVPLRWSTLVQRILDATSGHGVGNFLATKVVLQLSLVGLVPPVANDEVALGPGALASLFSIVHLLDNDEYIPSFQMKPAHINAAYISQPAFNQCRWVELVAKALPKAMAAYWSARTTAEPCLCTFDGVMQMHLALPLPFITVESFLCEILRRRNVHSTAVYLSPCVCRPSSHLRLAWWCTGFGRLHWSLRVCAVL